MVKKPEHIISTLDDKNSAIHKCAHYGFVRYVHLSNLCAFKYAQCCSGFDGHIQWLIHYKFLH